METKRIDQIHMLLKMLFFAMVARIGRAVEDDCQRGTSVLFRDSPAKSGTGHLSIRTYLPIQSVIKYFQNQND